MTRTPSVFSLEPTKAEMAEMTALVTEHLTGFVDELPWRPTVDKSALMPGQEVISSYLTPPPETGGDLTTLLDRVMRAANHAVETAGPGMMGGIPGGGLYTSALAEFITRTVNRHGGFAGAAPALIALEESVVRWMAEEVCGLPAGSAGILTTGGSLANLSAVVAARHSRLGDSIEHGAIYVSPQTHSSIAKAARIAGISQRNIRIVPCTDQLRMDAGAAAEMIRSDRARGLRPFLLVATAGATDTGAIDPLPELASLARDEQLWFHVDAAYGGFFRLTERGRQRLAGTELADSVTLDPHKTLFLPFGTGALVVRDPAVLAEAHEGSCAVLADIPSSDTLPDYAYLGPELTREIRGIRVWLPLHLHGVAAFRAALDEKLDLAEYAHEKLLAIPGLEIPWRPELSTVAFRVRPESADPAARARADQATKQLTAGINADGQVHIRGTDIGGRYTIRVCISAHRTHKEHVDQVLENVAAAAEG